MTTTYFEFREAANADELRELLKFRYRIYRETRAAAFCEENEHGFDVDGFDARSFHYGLFQVDESGSKVVGYHRPVMQFKTPSDPMLRKIVAGIPELQAKLTPPPAPRENSLFSRIVPKLQ